MDVAVTFLVAREACADSWSSLVNHSVSTQQRRIQKPILGGAQVEGYKGIPHGLIVLATSGNLSVIQYDYKARLLHMYIYKNY